MRETHYQVPLVLLVEDDAGVCAAVVRLLAESHIRFETACCVRDAIEALREAQFLDVTFDGLLADFDLPDGSGCQVVHAFRRLCPNASVALMSGSADIQVTEWMRRDGVALLVKPFLNDELRRWLVRLRFRAPKIAKSCHSI